MHPPPSCCAPSVPNKQPPRLLLSPPHRFALRQSAIANQQLAIANQHPLVSGSFWGRNRVIWGSFGGRFGVVLGSFRGRFWVGLGSVWGRFIVVKLRRPAPQLQARPHLPSPPPPEEFSFCVSHTSGVRSPPRPLPHHLKNGKSFLSSSLLGRRPYSQISKASAYWILSAWSGG